MAADDQLHRRFLEQLRALEDFRISYSGEHPGLPLGRADQDVQRLLEAQAYFSARTLRMAERALTRGTRRLFAQHFPYLLAPVPATGLVEARVDHRFVDPMVLPAGEELGLVTDEPGLEDTPPPVVVRTTAPFVLRPLTLIGVAFDRPRLRDGATVEMAFEAPHRHRWPIGALALHVDHLGELAASAAVFVALEECLQRIEVRFDRGPPRPVGARFGPLERAGSGGVGIEHPIERARAFFRTPAQDLFLELRLPEPPTEWARFTVRLHLSDAWPRGLEIGLDTFRLHVVPVVNLRSDLASPITVDGTRARHPVVHPDARSGFVPHSVRGVHRSDPAAGLVPLPPGFVPEVPGEDEPVRWEVDLEGSGGRRQAILRLASPEALEEPYRVVVDARWHQPDRTAQLPAGATAFLLHRSLEGVGFVTTDALRPSSEASLAVDDEALLTLLAARSRRTLGLDDLVSLIAVLRGPGEREFSDIANALVASEVASVPSAVARGGFRYRYRLRFDGLGPTGLPRLVLFCRRLQEVLEVWSTEEVVELEASLPQLDLRLSFKGQEARP